MKDWIKRILGREREEESMRTDAELTKMEKRLDVVEKRVDHLYRERVLYKERAERLAK